MSTDGELSGAAQPAAIAPRGREEIDPVACAASSRRLVDLARRVAATDCTVLIVGESGTGKEVLARFIHRQSPRARAPFVAVNCAAIPESMLEAMLFGYERGAFTGAHAAHPGKFEQAQGGTLLLDEITEMPLGLQAKLLRVLQEREVERLGGRGPLPLDVRVIATTNRRLREEVAAAVSAKISTIGSMSFPSPLRRCARAATTSCRSRWSSSAGAARRAAASPLSRRTRRICCSRTRGLATCASSTTCCSARSFS